ncbi:hypothetical protein OG590_39310 (plasmid) [Streptomyces goshikiensis]|uniref:hypothetical protein n=1 Tax=Streptomyces goshikiensis TaxID=1942 RepID=UPI002F911967|nr:hypothetical protein OG590_39310 [Streptomyces goshikiensis]
MPNEDLPADPADWEEPERRLYSDALAGRRTPLGSGDPSGGEGWGPERSIRATVVRRLLTDDEFASQIVRLDLKGAKIVGALDFEAATLHGTLELYGCHCSEVINLEQATAPAIYLENCNLAGIKASQLQTAHSFTLIGTTCTFAKLTGAHIGGQLDFKDAVLTGNGVDEDTLLLGTISVGSNVTFKRIKISGILDLMGAQIGGQLNLRAGTLDHRGRCALRGQGMETKEDALFDQGFSADGSVDLTGAVIGGSLVFSRASIHHPGKDPALDLARAAVKQNMVCEDGFTVEGMVLLARATISGSLWASGGQFIHPTDTAIDASGMKVGDVRLSTAASNHEENKNGFRAEGTVIFADAVIDGTLNVEGGSITSPRPNMESLNARGVKITRDLLLSNGFIASGPVALTGADVGGQVDWTNGSFVSPGQKAISARQLTARTSLHFRDDFLARGQVDLTGANVDGPLIAGGRIYHAEQEALILDSVTTAQDVLFEQGMLVEGSLCMRAGDVGSNLKIDKPNLSRGQADVALNLEGTTIKGTLLLRADTDAPVNGRVNLCEVKAQFLNDDPGFWPKGNVLLAGFKYDSLSDFDSPDLDSRKKWLNFKDRYSAQTYQQLASVYKAAGLDDHARDVLYIGQKRRPRLYFREKVWSWLLRLTVGYGYHPARVLFTVLLLEVFGWIYFSLSRDDLRPSSALLSAYGGKEGEARQHLQPALYTLDLLLPVITFGQRALWIPQGVTSWVATLLMVFGWILGGILLYGVSTAYQRRA